MAGNCGVMVGEFKGLPSGCFISCNTSVNTDIENYYCSAPVKGVTLGTVTATAYPDQGGLSKTHQRAGVAVPWLRKLDTTGAGTLHFIYVGSGRAYSAGDMASVITKVSTSRSVVASSSSGPFTPYTDIIQEEGFGLSYQKGPVNFDTSTADGSKVNILHSGYLQTFYLEAQQGQPVIVTYSLVYQI